MTTTATLSLTQNGQQYLAGDYTIYNNEWGASSTGLSTTLGYVNTTYSLQGAAHGGVTFNTVMPNYECPDAIWTFNEVYWGGFIGQYNDPTHGQVTTTVGNIKSLLVNYSTALTNGGPNNGDELLQLYVINKAGKVINDVSVETYGSFGLPNGATFNSTYSDSHITATVQFGSSNFNGTSDLIERFYTTTLQFSGSIDVGALLQYLVQQGVVSPNDYIGGIELGTEDSNGNSTFTVNSFNVFETVNSASTITDTGSQANQFFDITTNNNYVINGGGQYGSTDTVRVNSSAFGFAFTTSSDGHLHLAESGFGTIDIANVGSIQFSDGNLAISGSTLALSASSSTVAANLSALEATDTSSGDHIAVTLTDAASIPTIKLTAAQFSADTAALKAIGGTFNTEIVAPTTSTTISGGVSGLGTIVDFADKASNYTITANADHSLTVTEGSAVYHLSNVTELHFADTSDIVASQATSGGATVSSAQVTNLYAAVFGRLPDVGGLAYYEQSAAANPTTGITTYAVYFLSSPEYTNNPAHAYAQTETGEGQFITDTYNNLLHRAPEAGAVSWYETNVIDPLLKGLTPGTSQYAAADLQAHALVLTYFSSSAEFLGDVQVTAQNPSSSSHWLLLA